MKFLSLVAVVALAFTSTGAAAPLISNGNGKAIPGSYIVVLNDGHTTLGFEEKFNSIANRIHNGVGRDGRRPRRPNVTHKFKGFGGFAVTADKAYIDALLKQPEVAYVEIDSIVTIQTTQKNPPSWGLPRTSQRTAVVGNPSYKYISSAGAGVTAYIVDTGITPGHVDFGGRAKVGPNYITGEPATDGNGHGTHVAGTIGGTKYGIAKKVSLVGIKVLSSKGSGSTSGIVTALDWIIKNNKGKKAVVNMSLGGAKSQALNDAVERVYKAKIPVFVAAGNDATKDACNGSPSGAKNAFTVGATDITDTIATFSSWGKCVDIFAPGVQITSAWFRSKNDVNTISGTSMATPHVAGVGALILGSKKAKTAAEVYNVLKTTALKNVVKGNLRQSPNVLLFNGGGK